MKKYCLFFLTYLALIIVQACSDSTPEPTFPEVDLEELLPSYNWSIYRLEGNQLGIIFDGALELPLNINYASFGAEGTDCRLDDFMEFQENATYFIRSGANVCPRSTEIVTEGLWDISPNGDTLNLRDPDSFLVSLFFSPSSNALYRDFNFDPDTSPLDFLLQNVSTNQDTLQFLFSHTYTGVDELIGDPATLNTEIVLEIVQQN